jgi:hypothetical protein
MAIMLLTWRSKLVLLNSIMPLFSFIMALFGSPTALLSSIMYNLMIIMFNGTHVYKQTLHTGKIDNTLSLTSYILGALHRCTHVGR